MKSSHQTAVVAIALLATLLFCFPVQAEITLNGDLEIDISHTSTDDDDTDRSNGVADEDKQETIYDSSGRIKVVPSVRKEIGNLYMEAKAEILAKTDGDVATDDVWGKIGTSTFDFQIGRFEGWDLFNKSNDMLIVEAPNGPSRYEANYARGRFDAPGQIAVHILPNDIVGIEVGAGYGQDGDQNKMGLRPVVNVKFSNFEVLGGLDYLKTTEQDDDLADETSQLGYGARAKAVFGIATFNINYAHGETGGKDAAGNDLSDETTNSYGAYCDLGLGKGVLTLAGFYTTWEEEDNDYDKNHAQYFAAYAHPLPIDGATIKFAVSYATATEETAGGDINSDALGFKVRLNYNF